MDEDLPQPKLRKLSFTSPDYAGILLNEKVSDSVLSFLPKKDLLNICLVSRKLNSLGRDFLNRRRRTWFIPVITPDTSWSDLAELETLVDNPGHSFRGIKLILEKSPRILRAPEKHRIFEKIQVKTLVLDRVKYLRDQNYEECWSKLDKVEYFECDYLTDFIANEVICSHLYKSLTVIYAPSPSEYEERYDYEPYIKRIVRVLKKCPNAMTWASLVHCNPDDLRTLEETNKRHLFRRVSFHDLDYFDADEVVNLNIREILVEKRISFEEFCRVFHSSIEIIHTYNHELFQSLIWRFRTMKNVKLVYIHSGRAEQHPEYFEKVTPGVNTRRVFPNAHVYWERRDSSNAHVYSGRSYSWNSRYNFAFAKYLRSSRGKDHQEEINEPIIVEERDLEIGDYFQDNILTNDVITDQLFRFVSRLDLLDCCLVSKAFNTRCRDFLNRSTPGLLVRIDPLGDLERLEELEDLLQNNEHPFRGISVKFTRKFTYCMSRYPEELVKYDYLSTSVVSAVQRIISRIRVRALKIYCGEGWEERILPTYFSSISVEDLEYFKESGYEDPNRSEVFAEILRNRNAPNLKTLKLCTISEDTITSLLQECSSLVEWRSVVHFTKSESMPYANCKYSTFLRLRKEHLVRKLCVDFHEVEACLSHPSILQYKNKIQSVALHFCAHLCRCDIEKHVYQYEKALCYFFPNANKAK